MKKTAKTVAIAAVFATGSMALLTRCDDDFAVYPQLVYGPPVVEDMEEPLSRFQTSTEAATTTSTTETIETTTRFVQCVYGPPNVDSEGDDIESSSNR